MKALISFLLNGGKRTIATLSASLLLVCGAFAQSYSGDVFLLDGSVQSGIITRIGSDSVKVTISEMNANYECINAISEIDYAQWKLYSKDRLQMPAPNGESLVVVYMKSGSFLCGQVIEKTTQTTSLYDVEKSVVYLCNNARVENITRTPSTDESVRLFNRKEAKIRKIIAYNESHPQKWESKEDGNPISNDARIIKKGNTTVTVSSPKTDNVNAETEMAKRNFLVSPRYRGFVDATFLRGNDGVYGKLNMIGGGVTTTHGFQANSNIFFGAGLGYYYTSASHGDFYEVVPIYMDFRVQMSRTRVSPFFDMKLGSAVSDNLGAYASPSFGLRVGLRDRLGLNFTLGYTLMGTYIDNRYYTHHLNFSVGIDF